MVILNNTTDSAFVQKAQPSIPRSSVLDLVNLLLRETPNRVTVFRQADGPNPEIYVVTRVAWRDKDCSQPILQQLPRVLSLLETLRGSKGVPREVYLDSTDGIVVYLPSGLRVSELPNDSTNAVQLLLSFVDNSLRNLHSTMNEVEQWFWKAARQKGFSPEIVKKMGNNEPHYDSTELMWRFQRLLHK
jgi:hypothetical protein